MQRFSSYQESNSSNINGKKDIKQTSIDYYKENNNTGKGEIRLRDNNIKEKILFDDNDMISVVNYLKNRKKKKSSIEDKLNLFLTRKNRNNRMTNRKNNRTNRKNNRTNRKNNRTNRKNNRTNRKNNRKNNRTTNRRTNRTNRKKNRKQ